MSPFNSEFPEINYYLVPNKTLASAYDSTYLVVTPERRLQPGWIVLVVAIGRAELVVRVGIARLAVVAGGLLRGVLGAQQRQPAIDHHVQRTLPIFQ